MVSAESVATTAGLAQAFMTPDVVSGGRSSEGSSSLSRRSRVRRRNSRRDDDSSSDIASTSGDISSSQLFVKIPPADSRSGSSPKSLTALETGAPPRPPRSPRRLHTAPTLDNKEGNLDQQRVPRQRTRSVDPTTTRPAIDDIRGRQTRSESGQYGQGQRFRGVSLPGYAFRSNSLSDSSEQPSPLTPNTFNDAPPIPVFAQNRRFRHQPRDSGVTQQSTASSSVYPKSTSTEGSYPSPPSLPAQDMDDRHIIAVDPADESQLDALHEMDADEVSYRLRLLMQNNYYLPPAHLKPFSEIPSPDTPKGSPMKSSSPTFFDLFKVVKKKSTVPMDNRIATVPSAPMLRTTSDSSTLSGLLRPQQPTYPVQHPRPALSLPKARQDPKGRVVVVRERMDDLASVAKQVEQELKARETERHNASEASHSEYIQAQFVDPTDSVDLPLVPSNAFFGPQAALLRGMGIDSSIGAALLADQLPPSSPGSWSAESEDAAWRRALLHAAVDHSLNNSSAETPARSITSSSQRRALSQSSPLARSASPSLPSPSVASPASTQPPLPLMSASDAGPSIIPPDIREVSQKSIIGQPILSRIIDEVANFEASSSPVTGSGILEAPANLPSAAKEQKTQGLLVTNEPIRASSPTVPTTPLRPPPRRPSQTPINSSGSGSDNARDKREQAEDSPLEVDAGHLHAERGTPLRLSDAYESHVGLSGAFGDLTSMESQHNSATLSAVKGGPGDSSGILENISTTSGSHYSDDEDELSTFHTPQEHTLASTFPGSRPSLVSVSVPRESCESSQPSPATSAFRDAYDRSHYAESNASLSDINTLGGNSRVASHMSNDSRYAVVIPPPRVSSMRVRNVVNTSSQSHRVEQEEPGTPIALHVPRLTVHDLLAAGGRSSSYPASPISFFDAVEMQSRQDDEDESSDSDDDGEAEDVNIDVRDDASVVSSSIGGYHSDSVRMFPTDPSIDSTHSLVHDPRHALSTLLQQRNASSPQLGSRAVSSERSAGLGSLEHWKAISNVPRSPVRHSFWHKKHGKRHEMFPNPPRVSESIADWVKREEAKEVSATGKRPRTAGSRIAARNTQPGGRRQDLPNPSVRRLDGLLIEHMEREKEVLKRITGTVSKTST